MVNVDFPTPPSPITASLKSRDSLGVILTNSVIESVTLVLTLDDVSKNGTPQIEAMFRP